MTVTVEVDSKELERRLKALSITLQTEGIAKAVYAGAVVVEQAAKILAPVDTGALRDSIQAALDSSTKTRAEASISASVLYAIYVEMGTKKMKAQPYLRPALANNEGKIVEAITLTLQSYILKALTL